MPHANAYPSQESFESDVGADFLLDFPEVVGVE